MGQNTIYYSITVVYVKEEQHVEALFDVKTEPDVNPFPFKEDLGTAAFDVKSEPDVDGLTGSLIARKENEIIVSNDSTKGVLMKQQPPKDEMVSSCVNMFFKLFFDWL